MLAISINFLAGRFHATPWDRHVNEGQVEWSPWRLLRALTAASYRIEPRPTEGQMRSLVEQLAAEPPAFALPPASTAHTRHYMPIRGKTTQVFDAFIAVGDGAGNRASPVVAVWQDVNLTDEAASLLDRLLDAVTWLGRAESWVEVRRIDSSVIPNAFPNDAGRRNQSRILACMAPGEFADWAASHRSSGERDADAPADLWQALHADTGALQKAGWSLAPGAKWVHYGIDRDPFGPVRIQRQVVKRDSLDIACFRIAGRVLPRIQEAVTMGDRMRQALLSKADDTSQAYRAFAGRMGDEPEQSNHSHAYYLPVDRDGDGYIDHILIFMRRGFDAYAVEALQRVTHLFARDQHLVKVVLTALGTRQDYGDHYPSFAESRVWTSHTPFVPHRHAKKRGGVWVDTPADQIQRELGHHQLERASAVEPVSDVAWHRFRRERLNGGGARGARSGYGFRLMFDQPVRGPIALGYAAHMGLGQFLPVR